MTDIASPNFADAAQMPVEASDESLVSAARVKRFEAVYRSIWSDEAPPGYLERAASSMNLVEFEAHEKAKPAFKFSPLFKEQELSIAAAGSQAMERMMGRA